MEVEIDVKVTFSELYDYLLYHTYTGFSGMLGTMVGVIFIMVFISSHYFIYLIAGVVLIVYMPCSLFLKAKQQAVNNTVFKKPLHYKMTDEGISVSQDGAEETQSWENCIKAVSTGKSIILYTSKTTATIFPRKDLGDKKEALIHMISTHMPPKSVKIRF